MAGKQAESSTAIAERPRDRRPRPFTAPAEFPEMFNVQALDEKHMQGVVSTENIRAFLDAFGLGDREHVSIPFQHIKSQHGERWSLRVESPAIHELAGKHLFGHQWLYRREYPEESSAE